MMPQRSATEPYSFPSRPKESHLMDSIVNIFKEWQLRESRQTRASGYLETETDIATSIKNMTAEMASSREALSINNTLLKATNDLLLQITGFLTIFESQSYFWTEEWQEGEREATKDIERGDVHTFHDVEQLLDFLHSK